MNKKIFCEKCHKWHTITITDGEKFAICPNKRCGHLVFIKKGNNNMTVKELIKELEACEPDAVVSIVINEINLEVTEIIAPAPEIVELS